MFVLCLEGLIENILVRNYTILFPTFKFKYVIKRKCKVLYNFIIKVGTKLFTANKIFEL